MRRFLLGIVMCLTIAACTTPQQQVFALQTGYTAVLSAAVDYKHQPPCGAAVEIACSDPEVVKALQDADDVAAPAILQAQKVVRDPSSSTSQMSLAINAAQAALDLLRSYTEKDSG